jgi:outer membrane protein TolC
LVLEAKQNLYKSQIEVINLYYDKIYSKFEIDALLGRLAQK